MQGWTRPAIIFLAAVALPVIMLNVHGELAPSVSICMDFLRCHAGLCCLLWPEGGTFVA